MNNPHTHRKETDMNLERTDYFNEGWVAPTVADLLRIENRERRNAYISAELAEMAERDYNNDYDHSYDSDHDFDPSTYCDLLS